MGGTGLEAGVLMGRASLEFLFVKHWAERFLPLLNSTSDVALYSRHRATFIHTPFTCGAQCPRYPSFGYTIKSGVRSTRTGTYAFFIVHTYGVLLVPRDYHIDTGPQLLLFSDFILNRASCCYVPHSGFDYRVVDTQRRVSKVLSRRDIFSRTARWGDASLRSR